MIPQAIYLYDQPTMPISLFCVMHRAKHQSALNAKHPEQILCRLRVTRANRITAYKHAIDGLVIGRIDVVLAV